MLEFFRKIVSSRVGTIVVIALLVLIALAFAGSGVMSTRGTSGAGGGDTLVDVGGDRIGAESARLAANSALDTVKQSQPTITMPAFIAAGGLEQVLGSLTDRAAMVVWGDDHGVVAGDRLVDSEIAKMPAFLGPDGKFDQNRFRQLLAQRGVSEALVRSDVEQGVVGREIVTPATIGASLPRALALRYAQMFKESRAGAIATLPAALFAPTAPPDDAKLASWYGANRARFLRPERRAVRYAVLDAAALKGVAAPSEADIAARYAANPTQYAATETRTVTQLIVADEASARAAAAEAAGGKPLAVVAKARGLDASTLGPLTRPALAAQTSQAVADAVFAAARGAVATPAKGPLGWHVVHVDQVTARPARTLAQARGEIAAALAADRQRKALADAAARVEDQFDGGTSVADVAKALGLAVTQTAPLTADGGVYGQPGAGAPPVLARVLKTAFAMEQENQPQIAEVDPGKTFVLFDVARIAPSAPAPLAEIRNDVAAAYMLEQGYAAAGAAARKVLAAARGGAPLDRALAAAAGPQLRGPLPPPQPVAMSREQIARIAQQSRQAVPAPLALLFNMARGTTKLLPAPQARGWFVVSLRQITLGELTPDDPLVASARAELGKVVGDEYAAALGQAIRAEVGVKRNEAAIQALRRQLAGGGGGAQ